MFLFKATPADGSTSSYSQSESPLEQVAQLKAALDNFVIGTNAEAIFKNLNKAMTEMYDSSLSLQRSMGGVAINSQKFSDSLITVYHNSLDIGASFKDVTEAVAGIAEGMGRIVSPSKETLTNMVQISKATGMGTKEVGGLITEMTKFGMNQLQATEQIHELARGARKAGLDAKGYLTTIQSNMKQISGFGFKSGVEGMKNMVKQAMLLRTNIESIGSKTVQGTALDPEGAITLAAEFQMLGGAVGKLADPFQLMHMAQSDMEGLQKELVNSTKAAVSFNKASGEFSVSTEDMYRLRKQAELTGANLEDLVNTGKEAAKMDYLKETFRLDNFDEDTQTMVAGLAEVGKGGKVSITIPGMETLEAATAEDLALKLKDGETQKALAEYQRKAGLDEKNLAIEQMTITENQAKDVNIIKEAVLKDMGTGREAFLKSIQESNKAVGEAYKGLAAPSTGLAGTAATPINEALKLGAQSVTIDPSVIRTMQTGIDEMKNNPLQSSTPAPTVNSQDAFIPASGEAPKIMAAGKIFKGIVGDDAAMGVGLGDALNKKSGGMNVGGKIDVNVNVNGSVSGDNNTISKMFEDPKVQKQIMDTVLYKLEMYKKQQGVI